MERQHAQAHRQDARSGVTGDVSMTPIYSGTGPSRMTAAVVRFTPGARTNWHRHDVGQTLHVNEGVVGIRDGSVVRARAGDTVSGTISRVCVPPYEDAPVGFASLFGRNATLTGGPATIRAYLEAALPQVLDETINRGQVFDRELPLSGIAGAYRLMNSREALKVLIRP